jgi:hypothetical protein
MCEQPCEAFVISETTRGCLRLYTTSRSQVHFARAYLLLIIVGSCHAATISPLGTTSHSIANSTILHHLKTTPKISRTRSRNALRILSTATQGLRFLSLSHRPHSALLFSRHESFHLLCNRQAATFALQPVSG